MPSEQCFYNDYNPRRTGLTLFYHSRFETGRRPLEVIAMLAAKPMFENTEQAMTLTDDYLDLNETDVYVYFTSGFLVLIHTVNRSRFQVGMDKLLRIGYEKKQKSEAINYLNLPTN